MAKKKKKSSSKSKDIKIDTEKSLRQLAEDRRIEIERILVHSGNIAKSVTEMGAKVLELEEKFRAKSEDLVRVQALLDFANERLTKIATSGFGIAKNARGEIVLLNAPPFSDFLAVQRVANVSLYEAAMLIEDTDLRSLATEHIGRANVQRDEVLLAKMKDRVIRILQTQKKEG